LNCSSQDEKPPPPLPQDAAWADDPTAITAAIIAMVPIRLQRATVRVPIPVIRISFTFLAFEFLAIKYFGSALWLLHTRLVTETLPWRTGAVGRGLLPRHKSGRLSAHLERAEPSACPGFRVLTD
jgi:hypothetical protein